MAEKLVLRLGTQTKENMTELIENSTPQSIKIPKYLAFNVFEGSRFAAALQKIVIELKMN